MYSQVTPTSMRLLGIAGGGVLLQSVQENYLIEDISTKKGTDGKIIYTHGLLNVEFKKK